MDKSTLKRRNKLVGSAVVGIAVLMMGAAIASSEFFDVLCAKLGLDGRTQRATESPKDITGVDVTVRFDANTDKQLPWQFHPVEKSVTMKVGETKTIFYRATNTSDHATTGTASFNVTPEKTGQYFNKIQCFCFQEQTLQPGQSVDMGVTFFIDPKMVTDPLTDEVRTITLSYTFYRSKGGLPLTDSAASADNIKLTAAPVSGAASVN